MNNATETIKLVLLLDAFCEAFNRHDPDAIVSMITDDCEFRPALGDKQFGASIKGKSAIKEAFINTFAMFPDAKWVPRNKNEVIGERGFSEWTFIATRQADGAFFEMDGVDLFFFKDGKICIKDVYRKNREPIFPK